MAIRIHPASLLLLCLLAPACAGAPPPAVAPARSSAAAVAEAKPEPSLDEWTAAYVAALGAENEARAFYGELLLARGDEIVVHRAFHGVRGRRYRIGSVTKPFTAVAALQLAAAKQLDLDHNVVKYLPELPASYHPRSAPEPSWRLVELHRRRGPHGRAGRAAQPRADARGHCKTAAEGKSRHALELFELRLLRSRIGDRAGIG